MRRDPFGLGAFRRELAAEPVEAVWNACRLADRNVPPGIGQGDQSVPAESPLSLSLSLY